MTKIEYDKDLFELFSKLLDNEIEKMLLEKLMGGVDFEKIMKGRHK